MIAHCKSIMGWKVPAPGFHPLSFVGAAQLELLGPAHVDLTDVPVLSFSKIRTKMRKRYYLIAAVALLLCYTGLVEPNWLKTRTHDIAIAGLAGDVTIVHIADTHIKKIGFRERRVLSEIERINPDYVFLSGDLLKSDSKMGVGLSFLSGLTARRGVYMVCGNADWAITKAILLGEIPRTFSGWRVLANESIDCDDFTLVGISDPVSCRDDLAQAFANVEGGKPVFLLTHFYAKRLMAKIDSLGVAMIFSAHTHGGQVGFGPLVSRIPYAHRSPYVAGLYHLNGAYLYVTRGVGVNIFPLRFLCRPEIAVFHLRGA
jgi:hypothetical protein